MGGLSLRRHEGNLRRFTLDGEPRTRRTEDAARTPSATTRTATTLRDTASTTTPARTFDPTRARDARTQHGRDLTAALLRARVDTRLDTADRTNGRTRTTFPGAIDCGFPGAPSTPRTTLPGATDCFPRPTTDTPSTTDTRAPGEPFEPKTRKELDALLAGVDRTGDLDALNEVDNFRQTLPPDRQAEYDRQLEALREDPRLTFDYRDGAKPSAAEEDLARRGILAATFGNPELLEDTLNNSSADDGKVHVYVYPSSFELSEFNPAWDGQAPGLATPDGGIAIAQDFFRDVTAKGDNPFVHEFAHLTQRPGEHDDTNQNYPADFPFSEGVQHELESPEFQEFLVDRFFGGVPQDGPVHTGAEGWPTLLNLYRQFPEELKAQNPTIYRAMSEYYGYDPLTQRSTPPVQLNGQGNLGQALPALDRSFGAIAGSDGFIREDDLRAALTDPRFGPDVHAAVAYLLSNEEAFRGLDRGAGRGWFDGKISERDVRALLARLDTGGGGGGSW
ncbi:hypothetical protein L6R52_05995 [Myxococcota bacterium]|nr:hypothetical protein [Myxococcota bacterium]